MNITITLIAQSLSFFLFVVFTMKYIWPPLTEALEQRRKKIADGLAEAEEGHRQLEAAEKEVSALLSEGKRKSREIIGQAEKRRDEIIEQARRDADAEGERILAAARSEVAQQRQSAKDTLRAEVSALAIIGAERILQREVDKTAHNEVLNKLSADF